MRPTPRRGSCCAGPGTGKTVVGLHRAAWLVYNDTRLTAGRILVIGPSDRFLRFVSAVLPTLGEARSCRPPSTGCLDRRTRPAATSVGSTCWRFEERVRTGRDQGRAHADPSRRGGRDGGSSPSSGHPLPGSSRGASVGVSWPTLTDSAPATSAARPTRCGRCAPQRRPCASSGADRSSSRSAPTRRGSTPGWPSPATAHCLTRYGLA